jgi:hypothetical protein
MGLSSHCIETSANRSTISKLASQPKNVRVIWIPSKRFGGTPAPLVAHLPTQSGLRHTDSAFGPTGC